MLCAVGNLGVNAFFITKTPQNIVARLTKEIVQILNRPDANEAVLKQGMDVYIDQYARSFRHLYQIRIRQMGTHHSRDRYYYELISCVTWAVNHFTRFTLCLIYVSYCFN